MVANLADEMSFMVDVIRGMKKSWLFLSLITLQSSAMASTELRDFA